jgi:hypothetical protein
MTWRRLFSACALALALAGCAGNPARMVGSATVRAPAVPAAELPCVQTTHGCLSLNPDVTPATVTSTICTSGYTRSVRPASSYTQAIKKRLLREAGLSESRQSDYELDHIVPLPLGGHPRKLSNLALQPWDGEHGAIRKDRLEVRLQHLVCRRQLGLHAAQICIAEDWEACAAKYLP